MWNVKKLDSVLFSVFVIMSCVFVGLTTSTLLLHAKSPENGRPGQNQNDNRYSSENRGEREGRRGPGNPFMEILDTDRDHMISAEELSKAVSNLKKLDSDNNGSLSSDELHMQKGNSDSGSGPERRHRPEDPIMKVLDSDSDGALSAQEIGDAVASLKKLDINKDGKLSENEIRPERGERPERPMQNRRPGE